MAYHQVPNIGVSIGSGHSNRDQSDTPSMKRLTVGLPRGNKSGSAPGEANTRKSFRISDLRLEP